MQNELFRAFEADLHAVAHIHAALDAITQPVCVASSGSPQRMRVTLGHAGLHDRFAPNIFSALQVQNGKPAPDLFLFAAGQMKARPERCVVIEDSVPGVTASLRRRDGGVRLSRRQPLRARSRRDAAHGGRGGNI